MVNSYTFSFKLNIKIKRINMRLQKFKIPVHSEDQCIEILKIIFDNGYQWANGHTRIGRCEHIKALSVQWPKVSFWSTLDITYPTTDLPILTYSEFLAMFNIPENPNQKVTKQIMFKFVDYCIEHINDEKTKDELFNDFLKELIAL